jgi:hypothetical protein
LALTDVVAAAVAAEFKTASMDKGQEVVLALSL